MVKGKKRRTVVGDRSTLGEVETIRALESGDLSVRELCEKVGLLVVLEMLVISDEFDLDAAKSNDALDLCHSSGGIEQIRAMVRTTLVWRIWGTE